MKWSLDWDLPIWRSHCGGIVRLLHNAKLLSCYSAGAQTHEAITFCRSNKLGLLLVPLRHFLSSMAKNKRKRKLKEQDFQKVKLKVGKKLQPAQNTTDTSFKSRSIFLPNQLQKLDNEPTNQRNQTLKVRFSNCYYSLWTVISIRRDLRRFKKLEVGSTRTLCSQLFLSFTVPPFNFITVMKYSVTLYVVCTACITAVDISM